MGGTSGWKTMFCSAMAWASEMWGGTGLGGRGQGLLVQPLGGRSTSGGSGVCHTTHEGRRICSCLWVMVEVVMVGRLDSVRSP